eukprot:s153_g43.t1
MNRGIQNLAETHLAAPGKRTACGMLRNWARSDSRRLHLLPGATVPLRARSLTAGTWSGVWQSADIPCSRLNLQWPQDEFRLGRVQAAHFQVGNNCILGVVLYAWSPGPTWHKAREATRTLLTYLTSEIVHGSHGCRYICGDFNGTEEDYPELRRWLDAGWQEVQQLHHCLTGDPILPTCKGRTRPDRLYVSPELARHFQTCQIQDAFADHSAVIGTFDFPMDSQPVTWWPRAASVPWHAIDVGGWQQAPHTFAPFDATVDEPTNYLFNLGCSYEASFDGHFQPSPATGLPSSCRGRAQVFDPVQRPSQPPLLRASRPGEERTSSDLICRSLQRWFTQLRRLQSLLHNLRRDSPEASAVAYRLQTWQAIKNAKGFHPDFATWWSFRPVQHPGISPILPAMLPSVHLLEHIYEDFKDNYRRMESWNLRHRVQVLHAVAREKSKFAFHAVLGDATSKHVDSFTDEKIATILAVDPQTLQVHTDMDLNPAGGARWMVDGVSARVHRLEPCLYQVECDLLLCPEQALHYVVQTGDEASMLQQLTVFWQRRWNRDVLPGPADWQRIMNFVKAFVPAYPLQMAPISVLQWDKINRRYAHSAAAAGPDSFGHLDLQRMPLPYRTGLVSLLNAIEAGTPWPRQLLQGFGICVPKHDQARAIEEFRPIIILSQIYRSWGALRSRAILQHLGSVAPAGVKGFLPHREAGDVWHYIQALVEVSLQQHQPLAGVISDVKKAFESVPREPMHQVALHLGLPLRVLDPWRRFLASFERRFFLRNQVGASIQSNHGLPEGDGLSVVGMTIIDLCWDFYQHHFAPATVPISYVDNYEVLAHRCGVVLKGFGVLEEYMNLWLLELSPSKTHFWSTSAADRAALRKLGKSVTLQTADLGGALTYCRRRNAVTQMQRFAALDSLWLQLRRAHMPQHLKEHILRQAFWCKAFHACGITLIPWKEVHSLRTKAVRALGHGSAGSNPALRLGLRSGDVTSDPGCFQLFRVFMDFKRFLHKHPELLQLWTTYMRSFDGTFFSGPMSKLLEQCELIRWTVRNPPLLEDHDGCLVNLCTVPKTLLKALLTDAWHQRLAQEVSHRPDFAPLCGLQWPPSRHESRLAALGVARINALREGAFVTGAAHGKFDLIKGAHCPHCTAGHLGASSASLWRRVHDLFTDGSCTFSATPALSLASWAVVSATHEAILAAGPLPGLLQSVDRAELLAALATVRWTWEQRTCSVLWTDSTYVALGIQATLDSKTTVPHDTNEDSWSELTDLLLCLPEDAFRVQHVSSHRNPAAQTDDFHAWTAKWKAWADRQARRALDFFPSSLKQCQQRFEEAYFVSERQVDQFRAFHLEFAHVNAGLADLEMPDEDGEALRPSPLRRTAADGGEWIDGLPLAWQGIWTSSTWSARFSTAVLAQLLEWLQNERGRHDSVQFYFMQACSSCERPGSPTVT